MSPIWIVVLIGNLCAFSYASDAAAQRAEWSDFPFLVMFDVRGFKLECMGTIINPKWILTTAACIINPKDVNKEIEIRAGRVNNYTNFASHYTAKVNITALYSHEGHNPTSFQDDIGLIRLNDDLKFNDYLDQVPYISKDTSLNDYQNFSVVGWGPLGKEFLNFTGIKYTPVTVAERQICKSHLQAHTCPSYSFYTKISDGNILCSTSEGPLYSSYNTLFGGPLIATHPNGYQTQVGIISWASILGSKAGTNCTNDFSILVYTDIRAYANWIARIIDQNYI